MEQKRNKGNGHQKSQQQQKASQKNLPSSDTVFFFFRKFRNAGTGSLFGHK
jgi:hypothetical protein